MKKNEITIDTIRNLDNSTRKLIDIGRTMTQEQLDILIAVIDLTDGRPDRRDFALNWKGRMSDLPAALAQI